LALSQKNVACQQVLARDARSLGILYRLQQRIHDCVKVFPPASAKAPLALVSYWLLFVFGPLLAFFYWRGFTSNSYALGPLFLILCLIGERGFRVWKRLWGVK